MKLLHILLTGAISLHSFLAIAASTCLPLSLVGNSGPLANLCATPPGITSSDGFDDVCLLVTCCANRGQITIELPSGNFFQCLYANCESICSLSQMRSTLGGEACLSTCVPPPPPPPPDHSCFEAFLNAIADLFPYANLVIPGLQCSNDLGGLRNTVPFQKCYAGCSCSTTDSGCTAQNVECAGSCGFSLVPQTCVDFLNNLVWDVLGGQGVKYLEDLEHLHTVLSNFQDALKCYLSPDPL